MQIMSHNYGRGARALSERIGNGRLLLKNSRRPIRGAHVVNFGVQDNARLNHFPGIVLNAPHLVAAAADKRQFLLSDEYLCRRPESYTSRELAFLRVQEGGTVFVRTLTRADSGRGIVVLTPENVTTLEDVPQAPLYVQGIQKNQEYRVHVGDVVDSLCTVIDVRRKAYRSSLRREGERPHIWNHENGFVFKARGVTPDTVPVDVITQAKLATNDVGLDFAAVDVVWDGERAWVLEVNTAPGLEGRTVDRYAEFFNSISTGSEYTDWHDLDFEELESRLQPHRAEE